MYRNRGSSPNIKFDLNFGDNDSGSGNITRNRDDDRYYNDNNYWNRRIIVIQYDKSFIAIELIATLIIMLTVVAVYLFAYKVSFEDPIAKVKSNFLTAQLISIVLFLGATGLISIFTKSGKDDLIRNLRIIASIAIIVLIMFLAVKLNIDSKYTEDTFAKFYKQYEEPKDKEKEQNKISIRLNGITFSSLEEAYIAESVEAYTNFTVKTFLYMMVQLAVIIFVFYLSYRLASIEKKKAKLAKDDLILYDEEENVKF